LGRARAAFYPALTRSGISLEARFISGKKLHLFIPEEFDEFRGERFTLISPDSIILGLPDFGR